MDSGCLLKIGAALIIGLGSVKETVNLQDTSPLPVVDLLWTQAPTDRPPYFLITLNAAAFDTLTEHSRLPWELAIESDHAHDQLAEWLHLLMGTDPRACPDNWNTITAYPLPGGSFAFKGECNQTRKVGL